MTKTGNRQDQKQRDHARALGAKVRYWRQIREMTLTECAVHLEVSQQQMQKYEKGRNRLSVYRLEQLAELLEVSLSTLMHYDPHDARNAEKQAWDNLWKRMRSNKKRVLAQQLMEQLANAAI